MSNDPSEAYTEKQAGHKEGARFWSLVQPRNAKRTDDDGVAYNRKSNHSPRYDERVRVCRGRQGVACLEAGSTELGRSHGLSWEQIATRENPRTAGATRGERRRWFMGSQISSRYREDGDNDSLGKGLTR